MRWKLSLVQVSLVICLTGFFANGVFAQDEPAEKEMAADKQADQETDEDKYGEMSLKEISKDFSGKMRAYSKRYMAAKTAAEKREIADNIPTVKLYQTRLYEMVNEDPGSEAGLEIIDWWYRRGRRVSGDEITRLILKNYGKLDSVEKYVPQILWHLPTDEAEEQFRMLLKVNPSNSVKGSASFFLQYILAKKAKKLEGEEAKAVLAEVETLRDAIREKYPNAVDAGGATFAALIDAEEFAEKLEIGKPVPDIVGTDLDGVEFKLSDYDGKVRVISYWGDW